MAAAAVAKGEGERVGENLGNLLGGWAKSLYVGIAAVVALVFCSTAASRIWRLLVAAVPVGGLVMAPGEIAGVVRDTWRTLTG